MIIILIVSSNVANALHAFKETPIPEALLKPRNFNPHPYEQHFPHQHLHHHLHHQHQQQAIDINAISTVGEDYVDNSIYNDVSAPRETSLPALHPANGIFRFLSKSLLTSLGLLPSNTAVSLRVIK